MKKLNNIFNKELLVNYIFVLYLLSIILDLHIFYNSISTLIRVLFISALFGIIYIKYSNKKERKILLTYFIILSIYIVMHLINTNYFNIDIHLEYSILNEILYFIKMIMNIFIIYTIYKLEFNKEKFYKIISLSALIISLSIIICNIFKIGYTSYEFVPISNNIFDWFRIDNIYFYTSSSKGYFHLTNQISAIIILYLPILLIYLKEKITIYRIIVIISTIISLFMLGTRVSSYSTFIIFAVTFIVYIITTSIRKDFNYKYLVLLIFFFLLSFSLYNHSPLLSRNAFYGTLFNIKESDYEYKVIDIKSLNNDEFKDYLKNYNIDDGFYTTYYPLENDRDFYEDYLNMGTTKINDTRFLELNVIKRIKYLNNNKFDNYLGIGYDRIINVFNIESDYIMQYYSLGIVGVILVLGVNIILLLYIYFKMLFNLKRYFNFENLMLLFSVSLFLLSAYFTGNILNSISCIIPISFVLGFYIYLLKSCDKKDDYEYYLGFKTSLKNKETIIKEIFKEKDQVILYNINPLICVNFRNNKEIKKEFNKEKYNIPDGNGIILASKLTSNYLNKSIPGIELFDSICSSSIKNKYTIYLYGAKEDSVSKSVIKLKEKYPKINIVGYKNGYTKESVVLKDIKKTKPDILFVALGSPKQEEFIITNKKELKNIKIIMPVGGSFDVISGNLKRAPEFFIKLKLEWLYRMIKEPRRFKKVFSLIYFVLLVLFKNSWYNEKEE